MKITLNYKRVALLLAVLLQSVVMLGNVPHRLVYGFFRTNGTNSYGLGKFYLDNLQDINIIQPGDGEQAIFCGACADGIYYTCEYRYSLTEGPVPSGFYAYNIATGTTEKVGDYSTDTSNPQLKFQDMTYDYSTKTMYAIGFEMGQSSLFTVDLSDGKFTKVTDIDQSGAGTLACDMKGNLYTIGQDGALYGVDKQSGKCTKICDTGLSGLAGSQTMEFDHTNGKLYWAAYTLYPSGHSGETFMECIELGDGNATVTELGQLGSGASLQGMYIPYVVDGDDAPAAPQDIQVTPAPEGQLDATLSWTTPTTTFGGGVLTDLNSVTILRNGEQIAKIPVAEGGKKMSYHDTGLSSSGEYRYTLFASNKTGDGERGDQFAYIGKDSPDRPSAIQASVGEGCRNIHLSWKAPAKGRHNGFFSKEGLHYRIERLPDSAVVADNITDTAFTDNSIPRLGKYAYNVYAVNPFGESAERTADGWVLGKAIDVEECVPLVQDFSNEKYLENQWTIVDGNGDGYSWMFNTLAPQYQFRSQSTGAEYFINPGIQNEGNDADEWLISPPIAFKSGKTYYVTVSGRVYSEENVVITTGSTNETAKQEEVGRLTMDYDASTDDGVSPIPFSDYTVTLKPMAKDVTLCVGLHLVTPYPTNDYSMLQIGSISISTDEYAGIVDRRDAGTTDKIYNLEGVYLGNDMLRLPKGIYIRNGRKIIAR